MSNFTQEGFSMEHHPIPGDQELIEFLDSLNSSANKPTSPALEVPDTPTLMHQ